MLNIHTNTLLSHFISDAIDSYIEQCAQHQKGYYQNYSYQYKRLKRVFRSLTLRELTPEHLNTFIKEQLLSMFD